MADLVTAMYAVTKKEVLDFPSIRVAIPSGVIALGDIVDCVITVTGSDGKPKWSEAAKTSINAVFADTKKEILAIANIDFVDAIKMPVVDEAIKAE